MTTNYLPKYKTNKQFTNKNQRNRKIFSRIISDPTIAEWNKKWTYAGILSKMKLTDFRNDIGLYSAVLDNEIVYIGRAIEYKNGGFRKRLSDYRRPSNSGRKHKSGINMHKNNSRIYIFLLKVGSDNDAVLITKNIEKLFIEEYNPAWNIQHKKDKKTRR